MDTVAVIDFETTGISPDAGARATEIAAVLVRDGRRRRYQSLMTVLRVSPFIEQLTGINEMVRAPPAAKVMREVADFVGAHPMVAHNASFDCRFWDAELGRIRARVRLRRTMLRAASIPGAEPQAGHAGGVRAARGAAITARWPTPR